MPLDVFRPLRLAAVGARHAAQRKQTAPTIEPLPAVFDPDGPQDLVTTAFSCPWCEVPADIPRLVTAGGRWSFKTYAECSCQACGGTWTLSLSIPQLQRLTLVHPSTR